MSDAGKGAPELRPPTLFQRSLELPNGIALDRLNASYRQYRLAVRICEIVIVWSLGLLLIHLVTPDPPYATGAISPIPLAAVLAFAALACLRKLWLLGLIGALFVSILGIAALSFVLFKQYADWAQYGWWWRSFLLLAGVVSLYFLLHFTRGLWAVITLARSPFRMELREEHAHGRKGLAALLDYVGLPQSIRLDTLSGSTSALVMLAAAWAVGVAVMSLLQIWYEAWAGLQAALAACTANGVADAIAGLDVVMNQMEHPRSLAELDAAAARLEDYRHALEQSGSAEAQRAYVTCAAARGEEWMRAQWWATPAFFVIPVSVAAVLRFLAYRLLTVEGRDEDDTRRLGLFLRPFGGARADDRIRFAERPLSFCDVVVNGPNRFGNIDQILVEEASRFGPVYALAKKGQKIPPSGARRIRCADDDWKGRVEELVGESWGCVLCLASTESMRWELDHLLAPNRIGEALILAHPSLRRRNSHDDLLTYALREAGLEVTRRRWRDRVLGILYWGGRPTILWSNKRDETVYQLALRLFTRIHAGRSWKSNDVWKRGANARTSRPTIFEA